MMWDKHGQVHPSTQTALSSQWFRRLLGECLANSLPTKFEDEFLKIHCFPSNFQVRICWEIPEQHYSPLFRSKLTTFNKSQLAYIFLPVEIQDKYTKKTIKHKFCVGSFPVPLHTNVLVYNNVPRSFISKLMKRIGFECKSSSSEGRRIRLNFPGQGSAIFSCPCQRDLSGSIQFLVMIQLRDPRTNGSRCVTLSLVEFLGLLGVTKNQLIQVSKYGHYLMKSNLDFVQNGAETKANFNLGLLSRKRRTKLVPLKITVPSTPSTPVKRRLSFDSTGNSVYYRTQDFVFLTDLLIDILLNQRPAMDSDHLANRLVSTISTFFLQSCKITLNRLCTKDDFVSSYERWHAGNSEPNMLVGVWDHCFHDSMEDIIDQIYETVVTSPLAQYLDQTNVLAEYIHTQKFSSKSLGGSRPTALFRDVQPSSFGRLCSLYTIDGENAGIINQCAFSSYSDSNSELKTLVRTVNRGLPTCEVTKLLDSLTLETSSIGIHPVAWRRAELTCQSRVVVQERSEFKTRMATNVNLFVPQSTSFLAPQVNLIPFLLHDDPTRCLMGANMQRQAVALNLGGQRSIVSTGMEAPLCSLTGAGLHSLSEGIVTSVTANSIFIRDLLNRQIAYFWPITNANQGQLRTYNPTIWEGERVFGGQLLVDTNCTKSGELALGQNLLLAYASWYGYTYEDAILLNDQLLYERALTSVTLDQKDLTFEDHEELSPNLPGRNIAEVRNLNHLGFATLGSSILHHQVLIGKVTLEEHVNEDSMPLVDSSLSSLFDALLGTSPEQNYVDCSAVSETSLTGVILYLGVVLITDTEVGVDDMTLVRYLVGSFRHVQTGDKLCGRHGNKGVVSAIWPTSDLPYTSDGLIPDLLVSPLGVPSRMNVGQVLETLLGLTGMFLDSRWRVPITMENDYNGRYKRNVVYHKLYKASGYSGYDSLFNTYLPGKNLFKDGRHGESILGGSVLGVSYIFKLVHMVQDKIHARAQGVYSEITQQPVKGKKKGGGQRFGEMEVWAMEAYGASYELRDLLTLKSDDCDARQLAYKALFYGPYEPARTGVPECWNVLVKNLNALGIEIYK